MRLGRVLLGFFAICALAAGCALFVWRTELPPIAPPAPTSFDASLVTRGTVLAAVGNCITCHTASGGQPFAGGRPLTTPYGTIVTTNITPDLDTGIGTWSFEALSRAMHEGVDREGRYLYPAFPYDHFAKLRPDDDAALYAFIMTRTAMHRANTPSKLPFPFDQRILMAGWNALFLRQDPLAADPAKSDAWNRGAYLVEGLGHCGACHTPRNRLGAEVQGQAMAGAEQDGWWAPGLSRHAQAPTPWTADQMFAYLRKGEEATHGASAGPMQSVTQNLAAVPDGDLRAMAVYLTDDAAPVSARPPSQPAPEDLGQGAMLFAGACAICHSGPGAADAGVPFRQSTALALDQPDDFIHLVLEGRRPPDGTKGAFMPSFAPLFTDAQIAALAGYLRHQNGRPAWTLFETRAHDLRHVGEEGQ